MATAAPTKPTLRAVPDGAATPWPGPLGFGALAAVADSLPDHLAVLDRSGCIRWVNRAWTDFGIDNGVSPDYDWVGRSYCATVEATGSTTARATANGVRAVLSGAAQSYAHEYPCHGNGVERWFLMRVFPVTDPGPEPLFVVSHSDITQRRLIEQEARTLANEDSVTGLATRRWLDSFTESEWRRARRHRTEISLAMLDIDHFKKYNDRYGHQAGDRCLQQIADVVRGCCRRASDLAGRYGGEEFVLVLGETSLATAIELAEAARARVEALQIEHAGNPSVGVVTVSIGVASTYPRQGEGWSTLLATADEALFRAKSSGRNRVIGAET